MKHYQGALLAFTGDIPAVHRVGGFKEGVGFAYRNCRHCMATIEQIQRKVPLLQSYAVRYLPTAFVCVCGGGGGGG